jgi:hypothetical protein
VNISPNVPTTDNTDGGGATRDVAIAAKWDDLWLFEGELRTRVLPEVLSGTLQVRFQAYNYVAFLARYGQSIASAPAPGSSRRSPRSTRRSRTSPTPDGSRGRRARPRRPFRLRKELLMADLVDGRYPQVDPVWSMLGQPTNVVQRRPGVLEPPRSGSATRRTARSPRPAWRARCRSRWTTARSSRRSHLRRRDGRGTGTHAWAALYSGIAVPALMAQSADNTGAAAVAASPGSTSTLATRS